MDLKSRIESRIGSRLRLLAIERPRRTISGDPSDYPPMVEPPRDPWPRIRQDWYAENHVFLNAVYTGLFGRLPEGIGAQEWLEELRVGLPRNLLVLRMLESSEARLHDFSADWHESMNAAEAVRPVKQIQRAWLMGRPDRGDFILSSYLRYLARRPSEREIRVWSRWLRVLRFGGRRWMLRKLEASEERGAMRFDHERHLQMQTLGGLDRRDRAQEWQAHRFDELRHVVQIILEAVREDPRRDGSLRNLSPRTRSRRDRIVFRKANK